LPAGLPAELRHLSFHPHGRKAGKPRGYAPIERRHREDLAVAVELVLDFHTAESSSGPTHAGVARE
jgi:hypothetical protein